MPPFNCRAREPRKVEDQQQQQHGQREEAAAAAAAAAAHRAAAPNSAFAISPQSGSCSSFVGPKATVTAAAASASLLITPTNLTTSRSSVNVNVGACKSAGTTTPSSRQRRLAALTSRAEHSSTRRDTLIRSDRRIRRSEARSPLHFNAPAPRARQSEWQVRAAATVGRGSSSSPATTDERSARAGSQANRPTSPALVLRHSHSAARPGLHSHTITGLTGPALLSRTAPSNQQQRAPSSHNQSNPSRQVPPLLPLTAAPPLVSSSAALKRSSSLLGAPASDARSRKASMNPAPPSPIHAHPHAHPTYSHAQLQQGYSNSHSRSQPHQHPHPHPHGAFASLGATPSSASDVAAAAAAAAAAAHPHFAFHRPDSRISGAATSSGAYSPQWSSSSPRPGDGEKQAMRHRTTSSPSAHRTASYFVQQSASSPGSGNASTPKMEEVASMTGFGGGSSSSATSAALAHDMSGPSGTTLKRNQACLSCRKRKMKCDAVRPQCGTCRRSIASAASGNHPCPVPDRPCEYDDVVPTEVGGPSVSIPLDGDSDIPSGSLKLTRPKRRRAETDAGNLMSDAPKQHHQHQQQQHHQSEDVMLLQRQLKDALARSARLQEEIRRMAESRSMESHDVSRLPTPDPMMEEGGRALGRRWGTNTVPIEAMLSPVAGSGPPRRQRLRYPEMRPPIDTHRAVQGSDALHRALSPIDGPGPTDDLPIVLQKTTLNDSTAQQLWPDQDRELPDGSVITHLCELFFKYHPLRLLVNKQVFDRAREWTAEKPWRPASALIHAICAAACIYSPYNSDRLGEKPPEGDRRIPFLRHPSERPKIEEKGRSFKQYHMGQAVAKVEENVFKNSVNPTQWINAAIIVCYELWSDIRFSEAFFMSSAITRSLCVTGLDKVSGRLAENPADGGILAPAEDLVTLHERRQTLWWAYITDQCTSGPLRCYEGSLDDKAVSTHIPDAAAAEAGKKEPLTQNLGSRDLFSTGHVDDFALLIKACVLNKHVLTFNARQKVYLRQPSAMPSISKWQSRIDELESTFAPFDATSEQVTPERIYAHANLQMAIIHLFEHRMSREPTVDADGEDRASADDERVRKACSNVVRVVRDLIRCEYDLRRLHAQVYLAWATTGRILQCEINRAQRTSLAGATTTITTSSSTTNGEAAATAAAAGTEAQRIALLALEEEAKSGLQSILEALAIGGKTCYKASHAAGLLTQFANGGLPELAMADLLYIDGVIPTEGTMQET